MMSKHTRGRFATIIVGVFSIGLGLTLLNAPPAQAQSNPDMHPPLVLLDANGEPVQSSGEPVSTITTCGACHDTAFIATNSSHADGALRADGAAFALPAADEAPASSAVETNCFLCHTAAMDAASRLAMLEDGASEWANSATLAATGLISRDGDSWRWNEDAFAADGTVDAALLTLQDPTDDNCGTCHGVVHSDAQVPLAAVDGWTTLISGQVFSPQRISNSALNLTDKEALTRVWDVHTERVVGCTDCHYALNNPVYSTEAEVTRPEHLEFDPRRMDVGEYLYRPLHQFANSTAAENTLFANAERPCASCHNAETTHTWLPYSERHFDALTCETCHIPSLYAPALESVNWTSLHTDGSPLASYRGVQDGIITGFTPVLIATRSGDGGIRLAPYNLVSRSYWTTEDGAPLSEADVRAAWLEDGVYPGEIMSGFDASRDGALDDTELALDSDAKVNLITGRLAALGFPNARIATTVEPYAVHHNVIGGAWATRDCDTCHARESRLAAPMTVAGFTLPGVEPSLTTSEGMVGGTLIRDENGALLYQPALVAAPSAIEPIDLYVLGHNRVDWVNVFGALVFLGTTAGVSIHAGLRLLTARRRAARAPADVRPVYMYGVYERAWHWMQTVAIFGLLFTGLVIHMPDLFSAFDFPAVVLIHNGLAALLVINAALSLFYHLVSGEIRQFLPRPYGFFDQMIVQAKYYLSGIFRGDAHPFEKTRTRKLNPLQQITYFAILNVLLPAQMITGALMWGAQQFPDLTARLGGLGFLAPLHTLVAWTFGAFIVLHVYLTTTGHTPLASIRAMLLGWDEVETTTPSALAEKEGSL